MDATNQALNQVVQQSQQAQQNAAINEWILFTFVVIAPLLLVIIIIPVAIIGQRKFKCPNCGNWRKNKISRPQLVKITEGNKTITRRERAIKCRKCKSEYSVSL